MKVQQCTILGQVEDDQPLDSVLVIDCHAHYGHAHHWMPYHDEQGLLTTMARIGIDLMCVSSLLALFSDRRAGNDEVIALTEKYPERFVGFAVVNPRYPSEIEAELERCFEHEGVRGIKIHPATYVHDYKLDGADYEPVWAFAKRRDCPVLMHAGPRSERHTLGPQLIARVAERHPEMKLIIGHAGSYDSWTALDEHIEVVQRHDNLFLEVSTTNRFYRSVDYMVDQVGSERVLFGSDGPFHSFIAEFGAVVYSRISEEAKENVLGRNMARLLHLSKEVS